MAKDANSELTNAFKALSTSDAASAQTKEDLTRAMNAFVRNNQTGYLAALISDALSTNDFSNLPKSIDETWQLPDHLSKLYRNYLSETGGLWYKTEHLNKAFTELLCAEPIPMPPHKCSLDIWNAALHNEADDPNPRMDALIIAMGGEKWQPAYITYLQKCVNLNLETGGVTEFAKLPLTPLQWIRSGV